MIECLYMKPKTIIWVGVVLAVACLGYVASLRLDYALPTATSTSDLSSLEMSLVGTWQSADDLNFVRQFNADRSVVDTYAGEEPIRDVGTWSAYTGEQGGYIQIIFNDELYNFLVVTLEQNRLETIYLDGHGNHTFNRI